MSPRRVQYSIWLAIGLLLAVFGLTLTSARVKSATFDEDAYVGKGAAIWFRGNYGLRTAHPILAPLIGTAPLLTEPDFARAVLSSNKCEAGNARSCGRELLFYRSNTRRVLFLVRLPTIGLLVTLGALVYRWARMLYGHRGGLLALTVYAFEPNLLAHGRLFTLDLPAAALACLVLYTAWRFLQRPRWWRLVAWGVTLGLAGATRYTLVFMVPVLVVMTLVYAAGPEPSRRLSPALQRILDTLKAVVVLGTVAIIAALTIWAVYGFSFGPVPDWGIHLPAPAYFYDLKELLAYRYKPQDAFLLGRHYTGGWWPYFLVTMAVKTPLPVLILLGATFITFVPRSSPFSLREGKLRKGKGQAEVLILASVSLYYVLSLFSPFNIGHRHLLPILPLLAVLVGRLGPRIIAGRRLWRYVAGALVGWLVLGTVRIYPHFLAYFNELVGPSNGYRVLVDSNLDWGQDLPALEKYVAERGISRVYLSWFGESRPWQYDIPYRSIPSKPDELTDLYTRVYHPDYPPPGVYAISATNLQALLFEDKDIFAWFLQQEPIAQPGYSILIYEVPRLLDLNAPPATVILGSVQIDQVPAEAFETLWHTNDLRLRWFDPATSCILPAASEAWYVLPVSSPNPSLCPFWERAELVAQMPSRGQADTLAFYRLVVHPEREELINGISLISPVLVSDEVTFAPGDAPQLRKTVPLPVSLDGRVNLLGYRVPSARLQAGAQWTVTTVWQVIAEGGPPLKIFVQVLDDASQVRCQYDGLDIPSIGWQVGDLLIQQHDLLIPQDFGLGRYWVQLGIYDAQTGARLPVVANGEVVGTRLLLPPMEVP